MIEKERKREEQTGSATRQNKNLSRINERKRIECVSLLCPSHDSHQCPLMTHDALCSSCSAVVQSRQMNEHCDTCKTLDQSMYIEK